MMLAGTKRLRLTQSLQVQRPRHEDEVSTKLKNFETQVNDISRKVNETFIFNQGWCNGETNKIYLILQEQISRYREQLQQYLTGQLATHHNAIASMNQEIREQMQIQGTQNNELREQAQQAINERLSAITEQHHYIVRYYKEMNRKLCGKLEDVSLIDNLRRKHE